MNGEEEHRPCVVTSSEAPVCEKNPGLDLDKCTVCETGGKVLSEPGCCRHLLGLVRNLYFRNEELEKRNRDISLLLRILNLVQGAGDLDATLQVVLACVTSGYSIGFNRAFLFLLSEDGKLLRGAIAVGPGSAQEASEIWKDSEEKASNLEDVVAAARAGGREGEVLRWIMTPDRVHASKFRLAISRIPSSGARTLK